jgi:NADH-quinone oxidoreductase subunit M
MVELMSTDLGAIAMAIPLVVTFFFFFIGFAVKLPVFPFHTWLPDAHTDAPTAVSVILAGTLLKMGGYAMLRVNVTMFPDISELWAPLMLGLAVVNIVYGGAITLKQTDIKRLIAYSSISHMGFVLLGIFALGQVSMTGATLQMFSHGIITGLLFAVTGVVMHNSHERITLGGLGAMAVPATSGFIAEVMVFLGAFSADVVPGAPIYTIVGLLGILLAAAYILWTLQRVFFGQRLEKFDGVKDADKVEKTFGVIFLGFMFVIGVYPTVLTDIIKTGISPLSALFGG